MTVRLLLNENFPVPSIAPLRLAGFDVVAVAEVCAGSDDSSVLELAVREDRWLVTFDRDYGELVFKRGFPPPPAVVLLRVASYRPEDPAEWLRALAANPAALIGKFTIFDGDAVRSRSLPRHQERGKH